MKNITFIILSVSCLLNPLVTFAADKETGSIYLSPESLRPPLGAYSAGVETKDARHWIHVAGQTGVRKDGSSPDDFATQARIAMDNVITILTEGGMNVHDIVSYRVYMTHREDLKIWKTLSKKLFGDARPAGTLVFVVSLVNPKWRIEIEATAAK